MPDAPGPKLLAGGNPQIPKGDGDGPAQAYIEAMPEWKGTIARQLDDLIEHVVPDVRKAVRWNSPFYGVEGRGWFASCHAFTRYVKVTFLNGALLQPPPPERAPRPTPPTPHNATAQPRRPPPAQTNPLPRTQTGPNPPNCGG